MHAISDKQYLSSVTSILHILILTVKSHLGGVSQIGLHTSVTDIIFRCVIYCSLMLMLHGEITGLPVTVTSVNCFELFKHHDIAVFSTAVFFYLIVLKA
jgi:hypothetical protein